MIQFLIRYKANGLNSNGQANDSSVNISPLPTRRVINNASNNIQPSSSNQQNNNNINNNNDPFVYDQNQRDNIRSVNNNNTNSAFVFDDIELS